MDIRFTGQIPQAFSVSMDFHKGSIAGPVPREAMDQYSGEIQSWSAKVDISSEQHSARRPDNSISRCAEFGASNLELSKSR